MSDSPTHVLVITKPEETIRFAASTSERANTWKLRLDAMRHNTAHPEGMTIEVEPYEPGMAVTDVASVTPTSVEACADALRAEIEAERSDTDPAARFPGLYERMVMVLGHEHADKIYTQAGNEIDHDAELTGHVGQLLQLIVQADGATGAASIALGALMGPLYDVELAESSNGADLRAELDTAGRALRNARRIAQARADLLAPEGTKQ